MKSGILTHSAWRLFRSVDNNFTAALMWFFCFLACCLTAGQDRNAKLTKKLTKKVNRYTLAQIWRKLNSLGINVAEDKLRKDEQSMRNLRMLLITELAMAELFKTGTELKGKRKKKSDADAENGNVTNGVQTITAAEGELEEGKIVITPQGEQKTYHSRLQDIYCHVRMNSKIHKQ